MRIAIATLLIMTMLRGVATADGPSKGPKTKWGVIRVTNACDDAVSVGVGSPGTTVLEPNNSVEFWVLMNSAKESVSITASLVSDPAVATAHTCTIQAGKTTVATVTSSVSGGHVTLDINCSRPLQARHVAQRDAAVAIASGSGLGALWLIGMVLGRVPRRRADETSVETAPAEA